MAFRLVPYFDWGAGTQIRGELMGSGIRIKAAWKWWWGSERVPVFHASKDDHHDDDGDEDCVYPDGLGSSYPIEREVAVAMMICCHAPLLVCQSVQ